MFLHFTNPDALIYPSDFEEKIGFKTIVDLLSEECISNMGLEFARKIKFISDFEKIRLLLDQTDEFRQILMLERNFPARDYLDLRSEIKHLSIEGSYISIEGLKNLMVSYQSILDIVKYIENLDSETYPNIAALPKKIEVYPEIISKINEILDPDGLIRDNASEELFKIRCSIRRKQTESDRQIYSYLQDAKKEGWVKEDVDISIRNERVVIPVLAAHKKKIRGFIHDVSTTGQTVFMEPEEIFNLNNEIVALRQEERLEIIAILKKFSAFLFPYLGELSRSYLFLGLIDFIRAKAKFALKLEAGKPILNPTPCIQWRNARHPLLYLSHKKQNREIVPLDLILEPEERIVIISGPNAGGKSVCLKTIGLLQYMLQCGLLVPMKETSEVGIFKNIFVDIGDEQSIENDLSTYSSHLKNMKFWVDHANKDTLFLSDELGSGTEPQVGGAIAESILEIMNQKKAWGIVTTHYTNLKLMAKKNPGIVNAAMLFNQTELKPLYLFKKGLPGSSFAFEMALNIGLPEHLLRSAYKKTGHRQMNFERELQQIEVEKHELQEQKKKVDMADELLSSTLEKYQKLQQELENKKQQILKEAKKEAETLVKKANALIEKTIRGIKESQAEKKQTQSLRLELGSQLQQILEKEVSPLPLSSDSSLRPLKSVSSVKKDSAPNKPIAIGDLVHLDDSLQLGRVIEIKGTQVQVDFDYIKMTLPIKRLQPATSEQQQVYLQKQQQVKVKYSKINEERNNFSPYLDVRGKSADEAIDALTKLIDWSILYGEKHLEILHGKGNGILRQNIRENLAKNPHVRHFQDQEESLGGSGITLIELV